MTSWKVSSSTLSGTISIPPSKSQSMRALVFALMAKGKSRLYHLLSSPDVEAMILACKQLGAKIERNSNFLEMEGLGGKIEGSEDVIFSGNSGLVLRFIGALAGLSNQPIVLTGDDSVRNNRVVTPLIDALNGLGATAFSLRKKGGAPLFVKGPFLANSTLLKGEDSQPVSGMLIAASFAPFPIEIFVTNPGEKPWINLTLNWLEKLGIGYENSHFEHYKLKGRASYEGFSYHVPGDYSSSAFPIVAALLTKSAISLENLDPKDPQGDKKLIDVLREMGANIEVDEKKCTLHVKKGEPLKGITVDVNDFIDATPILAVLGCFAEGGMHLVGAKIARKKECDRLSAISSELQKMGAKIEEKEDELFIHPSKLKGASVETHQDHRMAMALTVAGLVANGETLISKISCVSKSYPQFFGHLRVLGAEIQELK